MQIDELDIDIEFPAFAVKFGQSVPNYGTGASVRCTASTCTCPDICGSAVVHCPL